MPRLCTLPPLTADQQALVTRNMGLVGWYLKRYFRCHPGRSRRYSWELAEAEAYLGMCEAARHYDPTRGVRFATYAFRWLWLAVLNGWRDLQMIRTAENGHHPDLKEKARHAYQLSDHFDRVWPGQVDLDPVQRERVDLVRAAIDLLPPTWADLVRDRMAGQTLDALGKARGISKEAVRQRLERSMRRMRKALKGIIAS